MDRVGAVHPDRNGMRNGHRDLPLDGHGHRVPDGDVYAAGERDVGDVAVATGACACGYEVLG